MVNWETEEPQLIGAGLVVRFSAKMKPLMLAAPPKRRAGETFDAGTLILGLGQVTEMVSVKAETAVVQTASAERRSVLEAEQSQLFYGSLSQRLASRQHPVR